MADLRRVTDSFSVAPQIAPEDVAALAEAGFTVIVNNRPDGEAPGQPDGAAIAARASEAGVVYHAVPVRGAPTDDQARAVRAAAAAGKTLAFCRSGTRSINAWALGEALAGARSAEELEALGAAAGYDLSWLGSRER